MINVRVNDGLRYAVDIMCTIYGKGSWDGKRMWVKNLDGAFSYCMWMVH